MTSQEQHDLPRLKAMIDALGDHWNGDFPLDPNKYEGLEHLVIFTYAMSTDWENFGVLLKEAKKELELMIQLCERIHAK